MIGPSLGPIFMYIITSDKLSLSEVIVIKRKTSLYFYKLVYFLQ